MFDVNQKCQVINQPRRVVHLQDAQNYDSVWEEKSIIVVSLKRIFYCPHLAVTWSS